MKLRLGVIDALIQNQTIVAKRASWPVRTFITATTEGNLVWYHSIDEQTGKPKAYIPSEEDIEANDWDIVNFGEQAIRTE